MYEEQCKYKQDMQQVEIAQGTLWKRQNAFGIFGESYYCDANATATIGYGGCGTASTDQWRSAGISSVDTTSECAKAGGENEIARTQKRLLKRNGKEIHLKDQWASRHLNPIPLPIQYCMVMAIARQGLEVIASQLQTWPITECLMIGGRE